MEDSNKNEIMGYCRDHNLFIQEVESNGILIKLQGRNYIITFHSHIISICGQISFSPVVLQKLLENNKRKYGLLKKELAFLIGIHGYDFQIVENMKTIRLTEAIDRDNYNLISFLKELKKLVSNISYLLFFVLDEVNEEENSRGSEQTDLDMYTDNSEILYS